MPHLPPVSRQSAAEAQTAASTCGVHPQRVGAQSELIWRIHSPKLLLKIFKAASAAPWLATGSTVGNFRDILNVA